MKMLQRISLLAAVGALISPSVFGANATWTGATSGNWTDSTNWSPATVPGTPSGVVGDTATFTGTTNTSVSLSGVQRGLSSVTFNGTGVGNFTFSSTASEGFTITSGSSAGLNLNNSITQAVTQTFNVPITLIGQGRFDNSSTNVLSTLIVNGNVSSTNATSSTLTLSTGTVGTQGAVVVNGVISDGVGAGPMAVSKLGVGTAFLLGANTFTGQVTFGSGIAGTLVFNSVGNVGSGASSLGNPQSAATGTINMPSSGTSPSGTLRFIGGNATSNRVIQTGSSANITQPNSVAALDASGSGALVWTGNVTSLSFNSTDSNARTFRLFGTSTDNNKFSGVISNSATSTMALNKLGVGNWIVDGNNTFTGGVTVSEGKLVLDYANNASVIDSTNAVRIGQFSVSGASGGTLEFKAKSTGTTSQSVGAITLTNAGSNVTNMSTGAAKMILNANGGAGLTVTAASIVKNTTNDVSASLFVDISSGGNLASTALITQTGGAATWAVVKDSTGIGYLTQSIAGANIARYTGATALTAGFATNSSTIFSTSGNLTLTGASRNAGALDVNTTGDGTLDLGGLNITLGNGNGRAVLFSGTGNYTIANGQLTAGSANELILHQFSSGVVSITAAAGNSTSPITKTGDGTLSIDNRASTGALYITDGVLRANGANVLSAGRIVIGGGGVLELTANSGNFTGALGSAAGQIKITGSGGFSAFGSNRSVQIGGSTASIDWASSNFVANNSALVLSGRDANATIDFQNGLGFGNAQRVVDVANGSASKDAVLSGVLTGGFGGGLIKRGNGTLEITGTSNTYMGDTWVSAGTLLVNNASGSGTGTGNVLVQSGGTLGGSGTISGGVTIASGGALAPGNSPGILNTGSLELAGVLTMELNGATVGTEYDQVNVTGSVSLVSGNSISLTLGYTPTEGTNFFLINNDGSDAITGLLNGYAQGAIFTVGLQSFKISYTGNYTGNTFTGGNDLVIQAVPEPATWFLLSLGLMSILFLRRRRTN